MIAEKSRNRATMRLGSLSQKIKVFIESVARLSGMMLLEKHLSAALLV
jgi:hypothetical protein